MINITSAIRARRFLTILASVACLGILVGAALGWSGKAKYQQAVQATDEAIITSKTTAVRILGTEKMILGGGAVLAVRLQNASSKDIKAFTISSGPTWVTTSYLMSEESFNPSVIVNQLIPLSSDATNSLKINFGRAREFNIAAVFFADETGDGDSRFVQMLADQHAGIRDQAKRILPQLRRLSRRESEQERALSECEAEILRLPTKADDLHSADYEDGLENAQRVLLSRLTEIKEKSRSKQFVEAAGKQDKLTTVFQSLASPP